MKSGCRTVSGGMGRELGGLFRLVSGETQKQEKEEWYGEAGRVGATT